MNSLPSVVAALGKHYGRPAPPPTRDAFELVLLENLAYLAPPARRREAFALLRETVGTTPAAILKAPPRALRRVTEKGILAATFAKKLRACARVVVDELDGQLDAAIDGPLAGARRALRRFPGIGAPGADEILLLSRRHALLAPDSNALRVLVRVGFVRDEGAYARTYAAASALTAALPRRIAAVERAHLLLQHHGRTLCKRTKPACGECPLAPVCAYARAQGKEAAS